MPQQGQMTDMTEEVQVWPVTDPQVQRGLLDPPGLTPVSRQHLQLCLDLNVPGDKLCSPTVTVTAKCILFRVDPLIYWQL